MRTLKVSAACSRRRSMAVSRGAQAVGTLLWLLASAGCDEAAAGKDTGGDATAAAVRDEAAPVSSAAPEPTASAGAPPEQPAPDAPRLGARAYATLVYAKPSHGADKLGYLRVGAVVERSTEPVSTSKCKGGWYQIRPRGYVCAGEGATIDLDDPVLRAAERRPDMSKPLPYRYGFVRSVAPLYLRVPSSQQQYDSEFKLGEHLEWFKEHKAEVQSADLGADDVAVDARGVPIPGKRLGELGRGKSTSEMSLGELFGGQSDDDPPPFWLRDGARLIPNVSDFQVPQYAVFADRARRHTGLAFIGSFTSGVHSLRRRFAITTDLRLAPTTKVKPDSGSPFHGVELGPSTGWSLPMGIIKLRDAKAYSLGESGATAVGDLPRRSAHRLAGKVRRVDGTKYLELVDGRWARDDDIGIAVAPRKWPSVAENGEKWIEIALSEQTLVLWEGKTPVYMTLVSTGRPAIGDPETTTASPRGVFRIYAKHISATMDSDEGSGRRLEKKPGDPGYVPTKGDGVYGVSLRRGHGLFQLRDVPHIQYFSKNYALHGAYWHDVFGIPRSHGCINLAPVDSHRVFGWTEPQIPAGWHGVNTDKGTTVVLHK